MDTARYVFALSIICLSAALVYFTWQIGVISQQIPDILHSVETTSTKIEPVIKQANDIRELIPPIIEEVSEIRKQVPLVLQEVQHTREQIPLILNEVQAIRQHIPEIMKTVNNASGAVKQTAEEIKAIRPLVPKVLVEVKATREAIPPILDRADKLVADVRKTGKEASKGMVSGLLTGIISAPFELVGNLGKKVFGFSEEEIKAFTDADIELVKSSVHEVLSSDSLNYSKTWENPDNKTRGKLSLLDTKSVNDQDCKIINSKAWKSGKKIIDRDLTICLNEQGVWERIE